MKETIGEIFTEFHRGICAKLDKISGLQRATGEKLDRWAEESRKRREKLEAILYEKDQKKREELLIAYVWRGELPGSDRNPTETALP